LKLDLVDIRFHRCLALRAGITRDLLAEAPLRP
jgi:hypothetical protein